jgi:Polyketide cyclase / dehydrase and lipid transport
VIGRGRGLAEYETDGLAGSRCPGPIERCSRDADALLSWPRFKPASRPRREVRSAQMSRLFVTATETIRAPWERVWGVFSDTSRYPEWVEGTLAVTRTDGLAKLASTHDEINRAGPIRFTSHWKVIEYEPPRIQPPLTPSSTPTRRGSGRARRADRGAGLGRPRLPTPAARRRHRSCGRARLPGPPEREAGAPREHVAGPQPRRMHVVFVLSVGGARAAAGLDNRPSLHR